MFCCQLGQTKNLRIRGNACSSRHNVTKSDTVQMDSPAFARHLPGDAAQCGCCEAEIQARVRSVLVKHVRISALQVMLCRHVRGSIYSKAKVGPAACKWDGRSGKLSVMGQADRRSPPHHEQACCSITLPPSTSPLFRAPRRLSGSSGVACLFWNTTAYLPARAIPSFLAAPSSAATHRPRVSPHSTTWTRLRGSPRPGTRGWRHAQPAALKNFLRVLSPFRPHARAPPSS
jgi:hypothetical protein